QMWQTADAPDKHHAAVPANPSHRAPSPTPPLRVLTSSVRRGPDGGASRTHPCRIHPGLFLAHHVPHHVVILSVGLHVGGGGQSIGHVIEGGHSCDVPNVAVLEAGAAQGFAVHLLDLIGGFGEPHREVEHRLLSWGQGCRAVVL